MPITWPEEDFSFPTQINQLVEQLKFAIEGIDGIRILGGKAGFVLLDESQNLKSIPDNNINLKSDPQYIWAVHFRCLIQMDSHVKYIFITVFTSGNT